MKKFLTLILALVLSVTSMAMFSSCNSGESTSVDNRPVLKVGMECAYQPYNWTQMDDSNGAVPIKG